MYDEDYHVFKYSRTRKLLYHKSVDSGKEEQKSYFLNAYSIESYEKVKTYSNWTLQNCSIAKTVNIFPKTPGRCPFPISWL